MTSLAERLFPSLSKIGGAQKKSKVVQYGKVSPLQKTWLKLGFGRDKRLQLYRLLAQFTSDGYTSTDAIRMLRQRAERRGNSIRMVYGDIEKRLRSGSQLTEALRPWAPAAELLYIGAGEQRNQLGEAIKSLAKSIASSVELRRSIRTKMWVPLIYVALILGVLGIMGKMVLPQITQSFRDPSIIPMFTQRYMAAGEWVVESGPWFFGALIAFTIVMVISLPRFTGPLRSVLDRLPPYSWYRRVVAAEFMMLISGLLRSQVAMKDALGHTARLSDSYLHKKVELMQLRLRRGANSADVFDVGLLDTELMENIRDYGELSGFDTALMTYGAESGDAATRYFDGLATALNVVSRLALMFFVVLTIAALLLSTMALRTAALSGAL